MKCTPPIGRACGGGFDAFRRIGVDQADSSIARRFRAGQYRINDLIARYPGGQVPMARVLADIENEIRALAPGERSQLLRALLEELDEDRIEPVPAEEVFARLRADLMK